jgi:hypothetical protein
MSQRCVSGQSTLGRTSLSSSNRISFGSFLHNQFSTSSTVSDFIPNLDFVPDTVVSRRDIPVIHDIAVVAVLHYIGFAVGDSLDQLTACPSLVHPSNSYVPSPHSARYDTAVRSRVNFVAPQTKRHHGILLCRWRPFEKVTANKSSELSNAPILHVVIHAVEQLSSNLQSVILQTGGKSYGVEFPDKVTITPPLREDQFRIPKPYYDNVFYYSQVDLLER